jgi:hypothetical protein
VPIEVTHTNARKLAMTFLKVLLPVLVLTAAVLPREAVADEAAARLRMAALLEEAHLLLDELKVLDPTSAAVEEEGRRLRAADQALAEESVQLGRAMEQHNAAAAQLKRDLSTHRQHCPRQMSDGAAIDACNARGAELIARGRDLDAQHQDLQGRRADLNRRIELHNGAWRAWQGVRREHSPRLDTNEADAQHWVERAVPYMGSADFANLNAMANNPAPCRGLRLDGMRVQSGVRGMRRLTLCLDAVSAALPAMRGLDESGTPAVEAPAPAEPAPAQH